MKKWEYNIIHNQDLNEVIHKLPSFGADGWELVQITTANIPIKGSYENKTQMLYIAWFKRPIEEDLFDGLFEDDEE